MSTSPGWEKLRIGKIAMTHDEVSTALSGSYLWQPTARQIADSHLTRFMRRHAMASLEELLRRSSDDVAWFWQAVFEDLSIRFAKPYSQLLDLSAGAALPRWCVDGVMNIVANCLDRYAGTPTDSRCAIRFENEAGDVDTLTYAQLRALVNRAAGALGELGIKPGEVVGVFMPMVPQIVAAMLAIIKIGGIFLPLFSGYGAPAIAARLNDAQAAALFTADACVRRGKTIHLRPIADQAAAMVPTLRHVIAWNSAGDDPWRKLLSRQSDRAPTHATAADDPMMLIYTSGTTGKPKGAIHSHCGFPIKAAQDLLHGFDLHADETLFWLTDMGWMMGPWQVFGTLLIGATMVLYDGATDYPGPERLWKLVQRHRVTTLGISPTLVRSLMPHGDDPPRSADLSSLQKFGSTGEPWNPTPWLWLFEKVGGGSRPILNYSGGTEISGGILGSNILTGLKPCSFSGPLPGMAVDVVDESGQSLRGQVGQLVIRKPWIGMTRSFWNDTPRYLETYWSKIPGLWVHGDWAMVDSDGLWYILGRSDDTLKIAGKRLGPAEVESVLVSHAAVAEAAAIGVPDDIKGQSLVCFCILHPGRTGDANLQTELRELLISALGKPLAPRDIFFVADLPRTRNAKIMRRVLRAAYLGQDAGDVSALENPGALKDVQFSRNKT